MVTLVAQLKFAHLEAYMAYHRITAVSYSFGITTIPVTALQLIQSHPTMTFLQKMGFNCHFPRVVAFGPQELGGLALRNLPVEQGIVCIMMLLEHIYNGSETGKLNLVALHSLQLKACTEQLLLAEPIPKLSYITPSWISAIRDFLRRQHQLQIYISEAGNVQLSRVNDVFLMDRFRASGSFSSTNL